MPCLTHGNEVWHITSHHSTYKQRFEKCMKQDRKTWLESLKKKKRSLLSLFTNFENISVRKQESIIPPAVSLICH